MILFFKVFFAEFIAEMGDKTQLMLIAYFEIQIKGHYTRYRCCDSCAERTCGSGRRTCVEFVPEWVIKMIAALAFLYFAASTIAGDDEEEEEGGKTKIKFAPLAVFCTFL